MMDCVLSGNLLVVFSLFCYAMCVFFEQINSLSLSFNPKSSQEACGSTVSSGGPGRSIALLEIVNCTNVQLERHRFELELQISCRTTAR